MMNAENEIITCLECKGSLGYCFCNCPYCGGMSENCHCNPENSKGINKILSTPHYSKLSLLNKSKKSSVVITKDLQMNDRFDLCRFGYNALRFGH